FDQGGKGGRGLLTTFLEGDLVRAIHRPDGQKVTIEALGVKTWSYEDKGYKVDRNYRITTPEGVYETLISVQSADSDVQGEGWKWFVVWMPLDSLPPPQLNELGQKMAALRRQSYEFLGRWFDRVQKRDLINAFLDCQPPAKRDELRIAFRAVERAQPAF